MKSNRDKATWATTSHHDNDGGAAPSEKAHGDRAREDMRKLTTSIAAPRTQVLVGTNQSSTVILWWAQAAAWTWRFFEPVGLRQLVVLVLSTAEAAAMVRSILRPLLARGDATRTVATRAKRPCVPCPCRWSLHNRGGCKETSTAVLRCFFVWAV
jgi:hypothetical protein